MLSFPWIQLVVSITVDETKNDKQSYSFKHTKTLALQKPQESIQVQSNTLNINFFLSQFEINGWETSLIILFYAEFHLGHSSLT